MSTAGPSIAGTGADDPTIGSVNWSNPGNITANDASFATAVIPSPSSSHYLKATNFGFAIPAGATINGISVEWQRQSTTSSSSLLDNAVRIVKGGTIGSTDSSSAVNWPTAGELRLYGSVNYLWGETWTVADINSSSFGAAISAKASSVDTAKVNYVQITITYTDSASFVKQQRRRVYVPPRVPTVVLVVPHSHPRRKQFRVIPPAGVTGDDTHRHKPRTAVQAPHPAAVAARRKTRRRGAQLRVTTAPPPPAGSGPHRRGRRTSGLRQPIPMPGKKRRGRVPRPTPVSVAPVPRHRRTERTPRGILPPTGRVRRRRVPGTLAFRLVRRRPRLLVGLPPAAGRKRRGRVPAVLYRQAPLRRRVVRLARVPPPWQGRRRRGRLYNTGIGATPPPPRKIRRQLAQPPFRGRRRRGRVPGTLAVRLARRRLLRPVAALPPLPVQRRRRRRPGLTVVSAPLVRRARRRDVGQRAVVLLRTVSRRGKSYKTGQFNQAVVVRQRRRRPAWLVELSAAERTYVRRGPLNRRRRVVRHPLVPGPYRAVVGQLFVPGAVVGVVAVEIG